MNLFRYLKDKDYRAYCKMDRRHRRELVKFARTTHDYDYGYLHDLVVLKLNHFFEYYVNGNNVWQSDESKEEVLRTLRECLAFADEIEKLDDCDWKVEERLYKNFYSAIGKNIKLWWD